MLFNTVFRGSGQEEVELSDSVREDMAQWLERCVIVGHV